MELLTTAKEVRELGTPEIQLRIKEARGRLREIRFKGVSERVENTAEIQAIRDMVARMETVLSERAHKAAEEKK